MGQLVLKDNATSTLSVSLSAIAGTGQTVTIAGNGSKFPTVAGTDWSYITIFDGAGLIETMKVTAHALGSTSFTVSRGSAAGITGVTDADVKAWAAGTSTGVACRLVSQVVLDIDATSLAALADAATASADAATASADAATALSNVNNHISDTSAVHAASAISYAGASGLSATDVEAALDELDAEKQPLDANTAKLNVDQSWTGSQRGAITTDNDGSFDLNAANNFSCTPASNVALTFTNHTAGQSGFVLFINTGGYTGHSLAATTKADSNFLSIINATGTYLIAYFDNGTNTYVTTTGALS